MRNRRGRLAVVWAAGASCIAAGVTLSAAETQDLGARVNELEQELRILKRQLELDKESSAEKSKTSPIITAGSSGFSIRSPDTNFVLKLRGYIQADGRFFPDDHSGGTSNDKFLMRRVRPILEGTVFDKFDYRLMLDFGSGANSSAANNGFLQDAYVTARLRPEFQVRAGKFKEPVGLERLQSGANLLFVERGHPTQLVPNRDVGIQIQGDVGGGVFEYAAGIFNGVADGGSGDSETADDEKDFAGRIFLHPFRNTEIEPLRGLGIGVAGTYGNQEGPLRTFVTPGQDRFFAYRTGAGTDDATANVVADGDHWRFAPQAYWYWGSWGLFGEYVISEQEVARHAGGPATFENIRNTAWQVAVSYVLTGEKNSWRGITPKKPFSLRDGGWGAWELAARVGQLKIDSDAFPLYANPATSASEAFSWTVGVNWHLNKNVKMQLNYEDTDFEGGEQNPLLAKGEKAVLMRVQVSF